MSATDSGRSWRRQSAARVVGVAHRPRHSLIGVRGARPRAARSPSPAGASSSEPSGRSWCLAQWRQLHRPRPRSRGPRHGERPGERGDRSCRRLPVSTGSALRTCALWRPGQLPLADGVLAELAPPMHPFEADLAGKVLSNLSLRASSACSREASGSAPALHNTDGDPLEMLSARFAVADPRCGA